MYYVSEQDVVDLVTQVIRHLLAPPAIAQRDRHCALGLALTYDVAVELPNDFPRRKIGERRTHEFSSSRTTEWFV